MPKRKIKKSKPHILIVEDEESQMRVLKYILGSEDFQVDTATDGPEGIKKINSKTYDIVITDMKMAHDNDGMDVLMAAKEASPLTEVFVMTAFGTIENAVQAMLHGAYDFIQKPINVSEFRIKLQRAISLKQKSQELEASSVKKDNFKSLFRQTNDYCEKLKNIKNLCNIILKDMGPISPYYETIQKISKESDI